MNTLGKTLVAIAAAATLAATALGSTPALASCGDGGYSAYDDGSYGYGYDYDSYGGYDHDHGGERRDFDRRGRGDIHGRRDFSRRH